MIAPAWIVGIVFAWIGLGGYGLLVFWKTWSGFNRYFEALLALPPEGRMGFDLPSHNPLSPPLGVAASYARSRLLWRLILWGAPPVAQTPPEALRALRSARIWSVLGLLPFALGTAVAESLFPGAGSIFGASFVVFLLICLAVLRPVPWRSISDA